MKNPERYFYPAVLTFAPGGEIAVFFPDLPDCEASGQDEAEALAHAKIALGMYLFDQEQGGQEIPKPSSLRDIDASAGNRTLLVDVYMPSIRLSQANRAVNRTVTLPAWLNAAALEHGFNFSQVLQDALKSKLHMG